MFVLKYSITDTNNGKPVSKIHYKDCESVSYAVDFINGLTDAGKTPKIIKCLDETDVSVQMAIENKILRAKYKAVLEENKELKQRK